jgi:scyllo-inositol 2-dehydrogenase (NADP+)
MKPIGIGIIGLGRAGWGMHCRELEGREAKFAVVAACDQIEERRTRMAEKYGCSTYADVDALIADPAVELVDIASRSCDHLAHASKALAAGKDVFLEKPICVSFDEAKKLREAAEASKGTLYVRHNRRFDPDFLQVKAIIDSGLLGDVYEIRLARHGYQRRDDWQTIKSFGGGQLLNWGPHIIDHALRFLDGKVKRQWSFLSLVAAAGDAEDHVKIVLEGENGRVVDLEISGGVAIGEPQYRVFGTKGSLALTGNEITLRYLDPEVPLQPKEPDPGTPGTTFGTPEALSWVEMTKPVEAGSNHVIWDHLYAAVREAKEYPIKLSEAIQVMEIVSAAKTGTRF